MLLKSLMILLNVERQPYLNSHSYLNSHTGENEKLEPK
jgi:hypothetical protein